MNRICIVGGGPAGFFTASRIHSKMPRAKITVLDAFPAPFGLLRYGVAPDHPEVKNTMSLFASLKATGHFDFYGNISVGQDVQVSELLELFHSVVICTGSPEPRLLNIPGENLANVLSAHDVVQWYNNHPRLSDWNPNLKGHVVIIGNGNVALDIARIFLSPINWLEKTEMPSSIVRKISESPISEISIVGRRGPLQSSFTTAELRELFKMPGIRVGWDAELLAKEKEKYSSFLAVNRPLKRQVELIESTISATKSSENSQKIVNFMFFRNPIKIEDNGNGGCASVNFQLTECRSSVESPKESKFQNTDEILRMPADTVIKSLGYQGHPLQHVPFNSRTKAIDCREGKVFDAASSRFVPGLFAAGWCATGAVGELTATRSSAYEAADAVIEDLQLIQFTDKPGSKKLLQLLAGRGVRHSTYKEWLIIHKNEVETGMALGKPRLKSGKTAFEKWLK